MHEILHDSLYKLHNASLQKFELQNNYQVFYLLLAIGKAKMLAHCVIAGLLVLRQKLAFNTSKFFLMKRSLIETRDLQTEPQPNQIAMRLSLSVCFPYGFATALRLSDQRSVYDSLTASMQCLSVFSKLKYNLYNFV